MDLAPLQLTDYFVHSFKFEARTEFDNTKPADLDADALEVLVKCISLDEQDSHHFAVDLVLRQEVCENKNIPYTYDLHIVGFVRVHPKFPEEKVLRAVEINGPSMLFGAAREILRSATGRGPYGPVLVPSTTFYKAESAKKVSKKKAALKKVKRGKSKSS